jgi:hypothetical protein
MKKMTIPLALLFFSAPARAEVDLTHAGFHETGAVATGLPADVAVCDLKWSSGQQYVVTILSGSGNQESVPLKLGTAVTVLDVLEKKDFCAVVRAARCTVELASDWYVLRDGERFSAGSGVVSPQTELLAYLKSKRLCN